MCIRDSSPTGSKAHLNSLFPQNRWFFQFRHTLMCSTCYWKPAADWTKDKDQPGRNNHDQMKICVNPVLQSAPTMRRTSTSVSYTHLRAHETRHDVVCRLLLEKKKKPKKIYEYILLIRRSRDDSMNKYNQL